MMPIGTPRANTYFGLGLLSRFVAKHSDVLACKADGGRIGQWQRLFAAALRSPKGELTIVVVNDAPSAFDMTLDIQGLAGSATLYRYGFDQSQKDKDDLKIEPQNSFHLTRTSGSLQDKLAPMSITVYSAYKLAHSDDGVMAK